MSICFFRDEWRPDSFYDKIKTNMQNQFHTLCLLGQRGRHEGSAMEWSAVQCGGRCCGRSGARHGEK